MSPARAKIGVCVDVFLVAACWLVFFLIRGGILPVNRRGFYCDDTSIGYPVIEETFDSTTMSVIVWIMPAIIVVFVEASASRRRSRRVGVTLWAFMKGFVCTSLPLNALKALAGELRPNFFDVCRPDFSEIDCSRGYIAEYTCTSGVAGYQLSDVYMSFPSAHTAALFYEAAFLILYLHKNMAGRTTALVAALADVALVTLAILVGYTRMSDRRHHWWDVAVGAALGSTIGIYSAFAFLFVDSSRSDDDDQQEDEDKDKDLEVNGQNKKNGAFELETVTGMR